MTEVGNIRDLKCEADLGLFAGFEGRKMFEGEQLQSSYISA